ncbi:MAG: class I SAM-dependent methyltransferase [Acidimicrobiia bacterium]
MPDSRIVDHPSLPDTIVVLPGTNVENEWARFHPMEALHHLHTICNPLCSSDLDHVIDALEPTDGDRALDVACGHGELLHRMTRRAAVDATGVDLSPWPVLRAAVRAPDVTWWLGNGADPPETRAWDIVSCLGASWIWDGFLGTAEALAARTTPEGRIAVGDLRLRTPRDRAALGDAPEAVSLTEQEQVEALRSLGLRPVNQIIPDEACWRAYEELVVESARSYGDAHPDDPAADHTAIAEAWMRDDFERLTAHLTWTAWVARSWNRVRS